MILICFSENSGKAGKSVDRNFGIFDKIVCSRLGGEYISTGWICRLGYRFQRKHYLSCSIYAELDLCNRTRSRRNVHPKDK